MNRFGESNFCTHCGERLIELEIPTGLYDRITGEKTYFTMKKCPKSKWYNIHTCYDIWIDEHTLETK